MTTLHPSIVDLYTNGWCPFFACALKSLDPSLELVETEEDCWHVAALDGDGFVWDVTGRSSRGDFIERWGEPFPLIHDAVMTACAELGGWEALGLYMTDGNRWGEPPESAWEITLGLAAEVLAVGRRLAGRQAVLPP